MIDSTNPRVMADNIRELTDKQIAEAAELFALQGDIEALGSYSSTEVNTGMKYGDYDIYRKVFVVVNLPNNTTTGFAHNIENLGTVLNISCVAQAAEGGAGFPIPYGNTALIRYSSTLLYIQTSTDYSAQSATITMEYTKAAPSALTSPAPDDTRSIESEEIPEVREEVPEIVEEPVVEVKKTTTRKKTN